MYTYTYTFTYEYIWNDKCEYDYNIPMCTCVYIGDAVELLLNDRDPK